MDPLWMLVVLGGSLAILLLFIFLDPITFTVETFGPLLGLPPKQDGSTPKSKKSKWARLAGKWDSDNKDTTHQES